ncbi:MAG: DUF4102 domain-containing protein [Gammaproteobacteria bacterium]|nr:DUF4102 domain-containing protein [Gammaproteobacteria bacterium]
MRLTEELLKHQPRPKAAQKLLWDELVTGFGVRLTPTRTAFVVQYRENPGRKVRRSIGHWPNLSVDSARRMARVQLGQASEQAATGGGATLREAIRTWFDRQAADWRPRYRVKVDRMLALYVEGVPSDRVKLTPTVTGLS